MKWIAVQPLIGGMLIGAKNALDSWPYCIISQGPPNEEHLLKYLKDRGEDIPYKLMDSSYTTFKCEDDKEDFKDVDIVIAVPVCSGLSLANTSKTRGADAAQNDNMYNITKFVLKDLSPKCFVFENAPALYTKSGSKVADTLFQIAKKFRYSMSLMKTDTFLHGIPQHRHRTFCFFWKSDVSPFLNYYKRDNCGLASYLNEIPEECMCFEDCISNLDDDIHYKYLLEEYGKDFRSTMLKTESRTAWQLIVNDNKLDSYIEYCDKHSIPKGKKFAEHIKLKTESGGGYWDNSLFYIGDEVNAIIGKNMNKILHPTEDRFYTIRELMHLMGMPHDMELLNPITNSNHICQNVPACTARDWVNECKKFVNGELKLSNSNFVKQNNVKQCIDEGFAKNNLIYELFE